MIFVKNLLINLKTETWWILTVAPTKINQRESCNGKYPWLIYEKQRTSLGERSGRFSCNPRDMRLIPAHGNVCM